MTAPPETGCDHARDMALTVGLLVVRPVTCPGALTVPVVATVTIADAVPDPALLTANTVKS